MGARQGAYSELQERSRAAEQAVQAAQQHYQAVTAGLSSGAGGQEETLPAQKIGEEKPSDSFPGSSGLVPRLSPRF